MASDMSDVVVIENRWLDRAEIEALIAQGQPVRLTRCDLEEADLSRLALINWVFDRCVLKRANLIGAKLEGTTWESCRGPFADFTGVDLTEATMDGCDFNNANLRGATLTNASFARGKMTGANFAETRTLNCSFEEMLLADTRMPQFSFHKSRLVRLDFQNADLNRTDFRNAVFDGCSLRDAHLADCRFEGADLRGADLGGIRLMNAKQFKGATISRAQAGQLLAELGLKVQ